MNWQRHGSVLAWPHGWQRPNKTEEWAYERCMSDLRYDPFLQVLCFPWATLNDLQRKGQHDSAKGLLEALYWAPPRMTLQRATVMQHIWAKDMLPQLQELAVTDVYWSHATRTESEWPGGIRVHPFPLYPVCCGVDADPAAALPSEQRAWLYSFIGAYEPGLYLGDARQRIFDLQPQADAYVQRRSEWHYQGQVYRQQIDGGTEGADEATNRQAREREYGDVLAQSVFSLCPSGSGPNSIRLWESLGMGCVPVLISDTWNPPGGEALWLEACVVCSETPAEIAALPLRLASLREEGPRLNQMRYACARLWDRFVRNIHPMELLPRQLDVWTTI